MPKTIKISACLKHKDALKIYQDATGAGFPIIPPGKNTVWHHFTTLDNKPAVIINQRGFAPTAADNERECNGCAVAMVEDPGIPEVEAQAALDEWIKNMLEL